ncbi:SDR family NAD(P)-dependent oxidoreductase [Paenibacillus sp. FSL L8-0158]|uniref:SDR family NAD(P)-dependent oxidoreductase n=1 Tax=Paenibacillus sp. FSL L8-0158 TaxID=2954752 RepID=UPI0031588BB6
MSNVVVITGAATGLGRATALKLAKEQYKLVIVDFNEIDGQKNSRYVRRIRC